MAKNWKIELIEAYPDLFRPPAGTPEAAEVGGWFATACNEHGQGEPVAERRDFEQVHVVYRIVQGQPVASGRRYDRSTDSFVYIRPSSSQIEEE